MLKINRQTGYAVRIVLRLSQLGDGMMATIASIALLDRIPAPSLRRLVSKLERAGFLMTARGPGGGVRLALPANQITLLDLMKVTEGTAAFARFGAPCPHNPIQDSFLGAFRVLESALARVRFDALATSCGDLRSLPTMEVRTRRA